MFHSHFSLASKACVNLVWPKRYLVKTTWSYLDLKLVKKIKKILTLGCVSY